MEQEWHRTRKDRTKRRKKHEDETESEIHKKKKKEVVYARIVIHSNRIFLREYTEIVQSLLWPIVCCASLYNQDSSYKL